jgi:hypothetical protein
METPPDFIPITRRDHIPISHQIPRGVCTVSSDAGRGAVAGNDASLEMQRTPGGPSRARSGSPAGGHHPWVKIVSPPGSAWSKPKNTARGTPWDWRTCRNTDIDRPRCREASRSAGPCRTRRRPVRPRAVVRRRAAEWECGLLRARQRTGAMACARLNVLSAVDVDLGAVHV